MAGELLITYATKSGSTAQVALTIGQVFTNRGIKLDIVPVGKIKNISQYQSVILGSAIRFGNWLPQMLEFVKKNQTELNKLPLACFTVHTLGLDASQTSQKKRLAYLDKVRSFITPRAETFFAGKVQPIQPAN